MSKKILYVIAAPPYQGVIAQETLDIVMTLGAFDQKVNLLLLDDGVFQLKSGQQAATLTNSKNIAAIYQALPLYDIHTVYIEIESLTERGLTLADLSAEVFPVTRSKLSELFDNYDLVLSG